MTVPAELARLSDIRALVREVAIEVPEPDLSIPPLQRRPGGMGLHLIRLATDSMTYRPRAGGGNILTLTRSLDPRPKEER